MVNTTELPDVAAKRVLLLLMPWAYPYFPGLSVALLRSILLRDGVSCDVFYANLLFSKITGGDPFYEEQLIKAPISELAFTPYYFDTPPAEAAEQLRQYVAQLVNAGADQDPAPLTRLLTCAETFLNMLFDSIPWHQYDIVGFSVMFQQTVSSLALARRIKARYPEIRIVFGGPSCSLPMGHELMRCFPEIDFVLMGEADATLTPLVHAIRSNGPFDIPGLLRRDAGGQIQAGPPAQPFLDLKSLPVPDYTPYYSQLEALGIEHFEPYLYVETSRGCWWGEKHHCTFCSIENTFMQFRAKPEDMVLHEIMTLATRHHSTNFLVSDNILHHKFYQTLLPTLARIREEQGYDLTFFFEVKANIQREQVRLLKAAGITQVQPGLESFGDGVLKLMNKGTTGIRQLQALKVLAEFDIQAIWNIIYRNPNEQPEDYQAMNAMIPFMHHIPPPSKGSLLQMLLQRFSPYFESPGKYGIYNVRPQPFYRQIFPRPDIDVTKLAYFFEYDHAQHQNPALQAAYQELKEQAEEWRRVYVKDSLIQMRGPEFVQIIDRRMDPTAGLTGTPAETTLTLTGLRAEIFIACDAVRSESELVKQFAERIPAGDMVRFLEEMVARRLVYRSAARQYLNLPLLKDQQEHFLYQAALEVAL